MKVSLSGVSHNTASVEIRERFAYSGEALPAALRAMLRLPGVREALILSTCNRVELSITSQDGDDPRALITQFLRTNPNLEGLPVGQFLYHHEGPDAVRHLFRVAASLDSMVLGEPQILGQLKAAYAVAKAEGALNGPLESLLTRAFSVAKRVRSETGIGRSAVSISFAAIELAREIFGSLTGRKVLIVGAGKMSELAARHLRRSGVSRIFVTNRTRDRARELAGLFQGDIVEYDQFLPRLPDIDIVITSSGAPHYILTRDQMRRVIEARRNRPMFLIDIAVPRNVDPEVNRIDNVFLYDIDDLRRVVDRNRQERQKEAEHAETIVAVEVQRMLSRMKAGDVTPTIVSLQEQLEQIRLGEIARARGKLGSLTPQQEEAIEALTRGIISKVAHGPISEMRRLAGEPDSVHLVDVIRRVFHLEHKAGS